MLQVKICWKVKSMVTFDLGDVGPPLDIDGVGPPLNLDAFGPPLHLDGVYPPAPPPLNNDQSSGRSS